MMTWLVSGSRNFPDGHLARTIFKTQFRPGDHVIHGGAQGVDHWAGVEAGQVGAHVTVCPADWDMHDKGAGPIRNSEMILMWEKAPSPKGIIIMWDGKSKGTADMMGKLDMKGHDYLLIWAGVNASV